MEVDDGTAQTQVIMKTVNDGLFELGRAWLSMSQKIPTHSMVLIFKGARFPHEILSHGLPVLRSVEFHDCNKIAGGTARALSAGCKALTSVSF